MGENMEMPSRRPKHDWTMARTAKMMHLVDPSPFPRDWPWMDPFQLAWTGQLQLLSSQEKSRVAAI